jgi:PHD/YefM family antitoxin component YafN of YafNO toxin-antitoxin module
MNIPIVKATNVTTFRTNMKDKLDLVVKEDMTLYVTRKNDENVVVINEKLYEDMVKTINRLEYEAKIQRSLEQAREGNLKYVTDKDLANYE